MAAQQLMTALVRKDGCQRKVLRIGISLERLGINNQQIMLGQGGTFPILSCNPEWRFSGSML
jgi:hypothetical protein